MAFTSLGGPRALARALCWCASVCSLCCESPGGHRNLAFCDITPFLSLLCALTAELPRNHYHYDSPSGFGPALRCYTSQGRTSLDGRLRSWGITSSCIFLFFSVLSLARTLRATRARHRESRNTHAAAATATTATEQHRARARHPARRARRAHPHSTATGSGAAEL